MDKKYLPSRQFVLRLIILVGLLGIIFGVYELVSYFRSRSSGMLRTPIKLQVKDVVQKDTNSNGIPDWEESLWGLDPNTNGPSNKEFILAKRKALAEQNGDSTSTTDGTPTNSNEALAREFFAVIMSLEQTGNLNDNALESVSEAIGSKIEAESIPDVYTKTTLSITEEDPLETINYYTAYFNLSTKYKDRNMGNELSFIDVALRDNDQGALSLVSKIGDAYVSFSKDFMKVPVPINLVPLHLKIANNYYKVGKSIDGLTKLLSDPIIGMKAIINYHNYNDALISSIGELSDNFK